MPKGIDPKAYAARITKAKKTVAAMDPATRAKIKEMYPKITKEEVVKQALDTKKVNMKKSATPKKPTVSRAPAKKVPSGMKVNMPKTTGAKPSVKKPMAKPLTGPAAVEALQKRVSPAGVKKAEMDAKKAIAKKYPGLTKSTATKTVSKASAEKPKATKRAPLETKRVGGIVSVPVKPKKTVY